jgi:DNA primase
MDKMFFNKEVVNCVLEKATLATTIKEELINRDGSDCEIKKVHDLLYVDKCPFCGSKFPSMQIAGEQYYCHSCGRGGDVIDFIMRFKNMTFVDAVAYLANRHGIATEVPSFTPKIISRKTTVMFEIYQIAAKFYFDQLRTKTGEIGMQYFNNRGVTPVIRSAFGLGYAGNFGDSLYQHLKSKGYSDSDLMESGLVAKNTKESAKSLFYDKFWNRVIFPILNADGRVIGFGGRIMGDGKPKYLNSQETPIFDKGKNLYCYNIAKNSKFPYYICCEGYMDAMSLHQFGFDCAVASLGTALTREQIQLLSSKSEILLAYDSDEAGIRAAKRAIALCREVGLKIRVIHMDGAKDPDEYLKKFGVDAFKKLIKNAETDKHFLIRNSKVDGKFDFNTAVEELF